jgi:hypothetical protein
MLYVFFITSDLNYASYNLACSISRETYERKIQQGRDLLITYLNGGKLSQTKCLSSFIF